MTQQDDGMKTYEADLTNARANAGAIVLYQHEELSLMQAIEGLKALHSARKAFLMVNPETRTPKGTVYEERQIETLIELIQTQLSNCQQRIQNMKKSFNHLTGLTWAEKVEQGLVPAPSDIITEESVVNGTVFTRSTEAF
jgi:DNA-binding transcriptional MerR regulator